MLLFDLCYLFSRLLELSVFSQSKLSIQKKSYKKKEPKIARGSLSKGSILPFVVKKDLRYPEVAEWIEMFQ